MVWSCICRSTRRLLVVKAYLKRRMRTRHHQNVRRELSTLAAATAARSSCSLCWKARSETAEGPDDADRRPCLQCSTMLR